MEKKCTKCGEMKPLESGFYKSRDWYQGACKICYAAAVRLHRKTSEHPREYDRDRAKHPKRKEQSRHIVTRWRKQNPDAYKAQTAVSNALRDGKICREPCLFCNAAEGIHAHHQDYSKPLSVLWLCAKCHHRLHANIAGAEGKNKATASNRVF